MEVNRAVNASFAMIAPLFILKFKKASHCLFPSLNKECSNPERKVTIKVGKMQDRNERNLNVDNVRLINKQTQQ